MSIFRFELAEMFSCASLLDPFLMNVDKFSEITKTNVGFPFNVSTRVCNADVFRLELHRDKFFFYEF